MTLVRGMQQRQFREILVTVYLGYIWKSDTIFSSHWEEDLLQDAPRHLGFAYAQQNGIQDLALNLFHVASKYFSL